MGLRPPWGYPPPSPLQPSTRTLPASSRRAPNFSARQNGLRGAGGGKPPARTPSPAAAGETKPLAPTRSFVLSAGGGTGTPQPPSCVVPASSRARSPAARRCFVSPRRKRAPRAQSERGEDVDTGAAWPPCTAVAIPPPQKTLPAWATQGHSTLPRASSPAAPRRPQGAERRATPRSQRHVPGLLSSCSDFMAGSGGWWWWGFPQGWGSTRAGRGGSSPARKYGGRYLCREFDPWQVTRVSPGLMSRQQRSGFARRRAKVLRDTAGVGGTTRRRRELSPLPRSRGLRRNPPARPAAEMVAGSPAIAPPPPPPPPPPTQPVTPATPPPHHHGHRSASPPARWGN